MSNAMLLAAIPVAANTAQTSGGEPILKRPTDLPIYNTHVEKFEFSFSFLWQIDKQNNFGFSFCREKNESTETGVVRGSVENGIKVVRVACCDAIKTIQERKKPIDEFVATGIEHSQCKFTPAIVYNCIYSNVRWYDEIEWYFFPPRWMQLFMIF